VSTIKGQTTIHMLVSMNNINIIKYIIILKARIQ